ncbi:DNA-binding response regulator [Apilactobacillus timberlakei]|uniref:response regulator transcription factor n=1 Tax=Apilactobacillus timberlakei TaxID=2008380 RepID=UPI0011260041|nr:response regulator transcription factor [Apilactobacillus timberlakei]TPR18973.1 DNA-binding response regulator [Apilactobacillus timberlakei]TPR20862.1 DNA-binding response regulator [Apilactobacillus timberlakei]TPR23513.1 DNA-binding response regulator [Apilactobacillus timberlakei]
MNKVFIIEDDKYILNLLNKSLYAWNYKVDNVDCWDNLIEDTINFHSDIILCDLNLPFKNGFYWIQQLRKYTKIPIIVISVNNINNNVMHAVELGADDYIMKPFSINVLVAKIKAILKRDKVIKNENIIVFGDNEYNKLTNDIHNHNGQVTLTPTESSMIQILLQNINRFVSKNELLDLLWQGGNYLNDNTLNVNLSRLRNKLSQINIKNLLQNKRGIGYKLVEYD